MSYVRASKFRHVFGKALKKEQCYDAIRVSRSSWDSKFVAVNPKFVAVVTESGGGSSFVVIPLSKTGRLDINSPMVSGHKGPLYDIAWCPHNDNLIASCSDDCTVKLWSIPEEGLTDHMTEPILELNGHQRRVTSILWHPTAENVLVSTGSDNIILIWNLETGQPVVEVPVPDQIFSMSFNEDGSLIACTCKDKFLRIIDSHTGEVIMEHKAHDGAKPPQCAFLLHKKVFTTGFSKMSERQYALWDTTSGKLECLEREEVDQSNGVNFIFYDPDTSMVYLVGKGDSQIRYYEVTDKPPYVYWLSNFTSSNPQKGGGFMPKRGLNVMINEVARFYKLHNNGLCEVLPFTVPRKSELFQPDIFPDTASDEPAISAEEFFAGKNALPKTMSLEFKSGTKEKKEFVGLRKSAVVSSRNSTVQSNSANGASEGSATAVAASALPPKKAVGSAPPAVSSSEMSELKKEIEDLKKLVSQQDKRIETLEGRMVKLEESNQTDDEEEVAA